MIRARGLKVRFGDVEALALGSLDLAPGERLGVAGPNGCGKSTLLRVLAGLLLPSEGSVEGMPPPGRAVLVHQRPYLFTGTARDNVAYALRLARRPRHEALRWLERLGALPLAEREAHVLSAGEMRRVALARALAVRPEILLLDEPFSALDAAGIAAVLEALSEHAGALVIAAPDLGPAPVTRIIELPAPGGARAET